MDEPDPDEFDDYTTALLFGGPARVVQVAVLLLYEQDRIRISRATRRVEAVRCEEDDDLTPEDDPVRAAVLDAVPDAGRPLKEVIAAVAASPEMRAIEDAMRETGLMRGRRRRLRPTRGGMELREIISEDMGTSRSERLAVLGPSGVEDTRLRAILRADDPALLKRRRRRHGGWSRANTLYDEGHAEDDRGGGYGGADYSGGDYGGGGGDYGGGGGGF